MPFPPLPYCLILVIAQLAMGSNVQAQRALNDSLMDVAGRIGSQLEAANKPRVTLAGITDPGGSMDPALITYVEELLVMHLSLVNGVTVVERRGLDQVMEEQRRTANGTFDEGSAIELGRLLAADAIVTGSMYRVDMRLHIILRILDTSTGVLIGSADTETDFPKSNVADRQDQRAQPSVPQSPSMALPPDPEGLLELRLGALGYSFFEQNVGGFLAEASFRSLGSATGRRGNVSIGLQLSYLPNRGSWADLPFDIGHVQDLQVAGTAPGSITVGSTQLYQNDLFLVSRNGTPATVPPLSANGTSGTERLDLRVYRPTNIHMGLAGLNIPLRWYFGRGKVRLPRLYSELGFGLDLLIVRADYEVNTLIMYYDAVEEDYLGSVSTYSERKPMGGDVSQGIFFTHMSLGGGLEMGRFSIFLTGRYLISTKFSANGRNYDRVRGNILALPVLAGAATDGQTLFELETLGAVRYGSTELERERAAEEGTTTTVTGKGVMRYWDEQHLTMGISFRLR